MAEKESVSATIASLSGAREAFQLGARARRESAMRTAKEWRCLTIALVALVPWLPTRATAQWIDIPYAKPWLLQVDQSAVRKIASDEFRVTWRVGRDLERNFTEMSGRINCDDVRLDLEHETRIDKAMWPDPAWHTWKYNYLDGISEYAGRKSKMDARERSRAVQFPSTGSSEFRVIRYLCESEAGFREAHELGGASLQARFRCDRADRAITAMCKPDRETRELLGLLTTRVNQVEDACEVESDKITNLLAHWLGTSMKCRTRNGEACGLYNLRLALDGLGGDLTRRHFGQACEYLPAALKTMENDEHEEAALDRFRSCVAKTVPKLDDRISPANVVAEGVLGSCRSRLPPNLASSPDFTSGILPTLTTAVLRSRQMPKPRAARKPTTSPGDVDGTVSNRR